MSEIEQIVSDTEKELLLKAFECFIKVENNNLTDADYKQLVEHLETLQTELEDDERWKEESFPDFVNDFKKNFELQWKNERACQSTTSPEGKLLKNFVGLSFKNVLGIIWKGIGRRGVDYVVYLSFDKMIEYYKEKRLVKVDMELVNQAIKDVKLQQVKVVDRPETYSIASIADNLVKNQFLKNGN